MAQFNSNASISTGGDCDRGSQGSIDWVYQGLVVYKDPENIKNLESLKVLEENARATLHLKSGPGAGLPPLVSPLSPAVFQEQLEILTALDLLDYNYPYLTPRTDALACLFREDNWKDAQEAVIEGDDDETIERFRLLATLMSGWDAFFNASINNRWGVAMDENGCYAFSSCLLNLEALTTKATDGEFMELCTVHEWKKLWSQYGLLAQVFPGVVLPRFVEAAEAYFKKAVMEKWELECNEDGLYIPNSCLLSLEALATKATGVEQLDVAELKLLWCQYCEICADFPGLSLPRFVAAVEAACPDLVKSLRLSSGRDSPVGVMTNFDSSSGATSPHNDTEHAAEADSCNAGTTSLASGEEEEKGNDWSDSDSKSDNSYHTGKDSYEPTCYHPFGDSSDPRVCYHVYYLMLDCNRYEMHQKYEDLKSVFAAEAEIAELNSRKLPLDQLRALPDYADELEDLERWLAHFEHTVDNRLYCKSWPEGATDAIKIINHLQSQTTPVPSAEQNGNLDKDIHSNDDFPAPAGVEEIATEGGGWNLEFGTSNSGAAPVAEAIARGTAAAAAVAIDSNAAAVESDDLGFHLPGDLFGEDENMIEEPYSPWTAEAAASKISIDVRTPSMAPVVNSVAAAIWCISAAPAQHASFVPAPAPVAEAINCNIATGTAAASIATDSNAAAAAAAALADAGSGRFHLPDDLFGEEENVPEEVFTAAAAAPSQIPFAADSVVDVAADSCNAVAVENESDSDAQLLPSDLVDNDKGDATNFNEAETAPCEVPLCSVLVEVALAAADNAEAAPSAELQHESFGDASSECDLFKESVGTCTPSGSLRVESAPGSPAVYSVEASHAAVLPIEVITSSALSIKEIEANLKASAPFIFCYTGPVAKGNDIEDCISCSEFGSNQSIRDYCYSASGTDDMDDEELELSTLGEETVATPAHASTASGKQGIWRKASGALGKASNAAGRKVRRALLAALPKPRLACFLMGTAPVLN